MAIPYTARVVSDGTPKGTKVFDAEGQEIKGITAITWQIDAKCDVGILCLSFLIPSADVVGEVQ